MKQPGDTCNHCVNVLQIVRMGNLDLQHEFQYKAPFTHSAA